MENGSNKFFYIEVLVLETKPRGEIFPILSYFPCFNVDVQPELVNYNFNDEKESLISRRRMQMTTVQTKKSKVWPECMDMNGVAGSRRQGKNDFNWFTKNNKCSNMNWLPFISPKRADYKVLQQQTQFNWMVHLTKTVFACICMCARASGKGGKMGWRARPTANHSHEWTGFSTATNFNKSNKMSDFCVNEEKQRHYKGEKKAKAIINTLLDVWPANMAG